MANKALIFELLGRDKSASKTLNDVGRAGENMSRGLKAGAFAAGAALAAAGVAIASFSVGSIKAYADAEVSQERLNFSYERFIGMQDVTRESYDALNAALQKKTGLDDDEIAAAEAILGQYQLQGEQIQKLTPLLLDYARANGKDLRESAEDFGRALLGQGRALKTIGIDFDDAGSVAANYDQLMAGLATNVGGYAEKYGTTLPGKLDIIGTSFGNIREKVGEAFVPALGQAADAINNTLLPKLDPLIERLGPKLGTALEQSAPAFERFLEAAIPLLEQFATEGVPALAEGAARTAEYSADVAEMGGQAQRDLTGFWTWLTTPISGDTWMETTAEGWVNFWDVALDGVATTTHNKSEEIKRIWSAGIFDMRDAVIQANMQTAGWEFAQGFADGIDSNAEKAAIAAENMAIKARNAASKAMDIASPSRVMRRLGAYLPQGFALGIEDETWRVPASSARMASSAVGGVGTASKVASMGSTGNTYITNVRGAVITDQTQLAKLTRDATRNARRRGLSIGTAYTR